MRRVDFGNFFTLFRSSGLSRSKKRRLAKNLQKSIVFTGFSHVPSCAHALKSDENRSANASRDRSFAKRASFHVGGRKMNPKSPESRLGRPPGADFGALGGLLGRCGGLLRHSWSALGLSGTALGAVLERSWCALGHSGTLLGASGRSLGVFGFILALPRSILELDVEPETIKPGAI